MKPLVLLLALAAPLAAPQDARAEGARTVFGCEDETGHPLSFTIAPDTLNAAGAGAVTITTPDGRFAGTASGHLGPYAWEDGGTLSTLLLDGAAGDGIALLLHQLDTSAQPPEATLIRLTCEVPS